MNLKKFKPLIIVVFIVLIAVMVYFLNFIITMKSSTIIVTSNDGVLEKGYSIEYKDIKRQDTDKTYLYVLITHSKYWQYTTMPYSGVSDLFLVFKDNKLEEAKTIFNGDFFYLTGSAELIDNKIINLNLKSANPGVKHQSIKYLIKKIELKNVEFIDVYNYFNSLIENLNNNIEIPVR